MSKAEYFCNFITFLNTSVNKAAINKINPCPIEKVNKSTAPVKRFDSSEANAIMLAKIGVEQGVVPNANAAPIVRGMKNKL